ncbi:ABC transporter ATP-binding protein [Nocardioides sp. AE5]|uniref:ABC transporter ATP-binding protein n=1 Tax=Nocardioides sp. AE5 TaxID=2962573 RepID=UPI002880F2E4|nr:ABC transporter ATP-binding protein [Nocardioides sp. AE5]MDT0200464.1 ABC transporter ATP-binding protein [Nocardioides sp. AE5]
MTDTTPLLALQSLTKGYGGVLAVDSVSFDVRAGTVHGLIGPNGAGKTTTFNMICGATVADSGSIRHNGEELTRAPGWKRASRGITRTFQNISLVPEYTVHENVFLGSLPSLTKGKRGRARTQRYDHAWAAVAALLDDFDLSSVASRLAAEVPAPVQKRVELARALAAQPSLLLLDEPVAGMTESERSEVLMAIEKVRATATILLVEHDMKFVMSACDRLTVLDRGRLIADGLPDDVRADEEVIKAYLGAEA